MIMTRSMLEERGIHLADGFEQYMIGGVGECQLGNNYTVSRTQHSTLPSSAASDSS